MARGVVMEQELVAYQAVLAAPLFRIGVRCSDDEILGLDYLPPGASLAPTQPLAAEVERQLQAYLADPQAAFSLPLRPAGTAFQRRVWAAIAALPCGVTSTYGDLARMLHSAPRAVGQACSRNPFPIIIPCHRVTSSNGAPENYSGGDGIKTKAWLNAFEQKNKEI